MKAALVTAIYGDYDSLKPVEPQLGDVELICVTDDPYREEHGWRVIGERRTGEHPNLAAKTAKMEPWRYTDAEAVVWIDASFRVTSPSFVQDVLDIADPIAQFVHPWRDCIYDEAEESARIPKYEGQPVLEQVETYRSFHPAHWGLWATGVIARHRCVPIEELGKRWLYECEAWTFQDQLSQAPTLHMCELRPTPIPGDHFANSWLAYEGSERHL